MRIDRSGVRVHCMNMGIEYMGLNLLHGVALYYRSRSLFSSRMDRG